MIEEKRLRKEIIIPQGVEVELAENFTVKKNKNEISKRLFHPTVELKKEEGKIVIHPKRFTKREKKIINTFRSHIRNMFKGVQEPYEYKLKICASHFPMTVTVEGKNLIVKNFLGEKVPRTAVILPNAEVKIEGDVILITSPDKEIAGQTAANFEQCTRITNKDRRIFQDGIWIIKKGDKVF
ncbi:50S ribosomal protein L6 [Candidatus Woesearchaeota archaeon]|nr:50S ribosomal protein L6 [Candidatus Woesearchaeota archaeon]